MFADPKNSFWRPSTASTASPDWRPTEAAGEFGWTSAKRTPTNGVASQAIRVKIRNETTRFIATPATRMISLTGSRARANERGSSFSSPSSPSSLTKPPIGSQFSV